ncbi:MAG: DUF4850 domain-containing protein [Xanthomonadales bacterium]|jgi:hypothetical protein|nr:DUF4850 domain-containing protein [Xanthomonadales bacterium]
MTMLLYALVWASSALPPCELPDLTTQPEASDHRVLDLGDGRIGVAMEDPMADPGMRLSGTPDEMPPGPVPPGQQWLWSEATDWLAVPRGWVLRRAAVGVNGSWVIDMHAPDGQRGRFRAFDTGACVGCALSAGAAYFADYREQAAANEFLMCDGLASKIHDLERSAASRRFWFRDAEWRRIDVEIKIDPEEGGYREVAITRD